MDINFSISETIRLLLTDPERAIDFNNSPVDYGITYEVFDRFISILEIKHLVNLSSVNVSTETTLNQFEKIIRGKLT